MDFKAKHSQGGEYDFSWQGPTGRDCPIPTEVPIPAPGLEVLDGHILPAEEIPVAKPATAWRTNQKRKLTKGGRGGATPRDTVIEYAEQVLPEVTLPIPTPVPISVHPTAVSGAKDSWASWDRETRQQPSPLGTPVPTISVERRIFGPRSPRPAEI
ncbi:hypothetical protein FRB90_004221 [Tulasnella sp. 427]|nr:hypothetical protein FRB90_004221 [Tulasnella sp. 427]